MLSLCKADAFVAIISTFQMSVTNFVIKNTNISNASSIIQESLYQNVTSHKIGSGSLVLRKMKWFRKEESGKQWMQQSFVLC